MSRWMAKAATYCGNRAQRGTEGNPIAAGWLSCTEGNDVARSDEQSSTGLAARYRATRRLTLDLAAPLSDADATIQPHPDASPAKWHLAHTTWFLETFVLRDHVPGYTLHDDRYAFLFNSYYNGEGARHARPRRGMISRPSLDEIREWRRVVDSAVEQAMAALPCEALALIELGIEHEQQHQELFLTDLLATLCGKSDRAGLWHAGCCAMFCHRAAAISSRSRWLGRDWRCTGCTFRL